MKVVGGKKDIIPPHYPPDRRNYHRKSLLRGRIRRNAHHTQRLGYGLFRRLGRLRRFPSTTYPAHHYGQVDTFGDWET